jgi:3-phenylpropionate/trans-cinnamate dioxygenase ferredoxin reductase subunit
LTDNVTDIVILGAGLAGGNAAKALREEGYDRRLVLLGDEPGVPFGRPPLSKTYLRGEEALSGWLVEPPDWYAKHDVEFLRSTATRIDAAGHRVELRTGEVVNYSKVLIATGGRNRLLKIPGADLPGVYQLRTVAECDAIKQAAGVGRRAVVVGMGFIGSEVAASLRQLGVSITAVLPESAPLEYVLGPEMGEVMTGIHVDHGVELITHEQVVRFEGTGHVERAITKGGRQIDCDFAIVAIGIQPNVEILTGTGVAVENGVLVDPALRTNVPDIYAAGDVANHMHPLFGRVRVEHYNNAEKQGAAAGRSMLAPLEYTYIHSFWSDQYEHKLEYVGYVHRWDDFIIRGSLKDRKLVGFYLVDGTLKAAVGFDRGGDPELDVDGEMAKAGRLIARGARPAPGALADENQDLALL